MDKTVNINLGGFLFHVEEEAFLILRDYINSINTRFRNVPGGAETIEDIESRIAEIFNSKKGTAGVIDRRTVEEMIALVGKPEDFGAEAVIEEPSFAAAGPKRMYRNPHDKVISGVCGGLGAYFNIDPVLFRILFVIFILFGGMGFIIYIVLWIAIPYADSEVKLREMYGDRRYLTRKQDGTLNRPNTNDGLNEVANATGKVLFFILRLFLVVTGVLFVITAFLFLIAFLMIFVFKVPGAFSFEGVVFPVGHAPEILKYIFSPATAAWVFVLGTIVILMPLLALIYWGVRMIFWFKARDGWFSLAAFVIWIISLTALSILLFSEGISFAERSSSTTRSYLPSRPDTLNIVTAKKIDDIDAAHTIHFPDESYSSFVADHERNMHINIVLRISASESGNGEVEVRKHSFGPTRSEAVERAESVIYNVTAGRDTLLMDEYFTIPSGNKWSGQWVSLNLSLPEGTIVHFDRESSGLISGEIDGFDHFHRHYRHRERERIDLEGRYWVVTDSGLEPAE